MLLRIKLSLLIIALFNVETISSFTVTVHTLEFFAILAVYVIFKPATASFCLKNCCKMQAIKWRANKNAITLIL